MPLSTQAATQERQNHTNANALRRKSKLAPELAPTDVAPAASSQGFVRVIIQSKGHLTTAQDGAIARRGGKKQQGFDELDAVVADVAVGELGALAAREDIAYISPDRVVNAQLDVTRETTGAALVQSGLPRTQGFTGKGVGIAIIDSGISASHPDFQKNGNKSRIVAAVNFTGGSNGDKEGHGTGVASVAAGNGSASRGYAGNFIGIAPDASLIDLKALDANGAGTTSSVLNAVNWAIANQKRFGIRVVNMSLGATPRESYHTDPLCQAVERAVRSGLVVVASAGNVGHTTDIIGHKPNGDPIYRPLYGSINSPGNSPYAITVGASDSQGTGKRSDDTMAQFSSKGPTRIDMLAKPDLVAPGRGVVAAMSQEMPNTAGQRPDWVIVPKGANALHNAYFKYYGTSFSAPVVSGTIALMLEANKSLTPSLVKASLLRTANALSSTLFANKVQNVLQQGAGQVNAAAAVEMALAIVPNADKLKAKNRIFGANTKLSSLNHTFNIGGEAVAASGRVLYSNGVLFKEKPVLLNGIMLSDGLVLGDGIMLSDGMVLGDGIMLDDGIMLSDGMVLGDGIMLADGLVLGDGIMLSDGLVMGDGIMLDDGIMLSDGMVLGDGIMLADAVRVGADGIMLSDGMVLGDGIMLSDGMVLGDGIMLSDGMVLGDGIMLSDGLVMGDNRAL